MYSFHKTQSNITVQVTSLRELHQQAQKYNSQLQEYNTKLQQDVALSNDSLQKLQVHLTLTHAACFHGHSLTSSNPNPSQLLGTRWHLQRLAGVTSSFTFPC